MLVQVHFKLQEETVEQGWTEEVQNQKLIALNKMQIVRGGEVDARFATAQLRSQTCSQLSHTALFSCWPPVSV